MQHLKAKVRRVAAKMKKATVYEMPELLAALDRLARDV